MLTLHAEGPTPEKPDAFNQGLQARAMPSEKTERQAADTAKEHGWSGRQIGTGDSASI